MMIGLWADATLACELDLGQKQLVDLGNLTQPWVIDPNDLSGGMVGFKNSRSTEPISLAELEREYCRATGLPYPITQMTFARSWMLLRVCASFSSFVVHIMMTLCPSPPSPFKLAVIAQGITARHAQRQASSEQAHLYAAVFPLMGKLARRVLEEEGYLPTARPKL
jgi:hypothetical protein